VPAPIGRWWPYHPQPPSPVPIPPSKSFKAELAARRSGDKAKLKKILKARKEEEARTMANLVRAAKGVE